MKILQAATSTITLFLLPKKRWIGIDIPTQVPRQQAGLKMDQQTHRGFFAKKWVGDFLLLSFLPCC